MVSQTPIYDELIATLAKPKQEAGTTKAPARAKSTRASAGARASAGDSAAESAAARKNRRHRADP